MSAHAARPRRLAGFLALLRYDPSRPARPAAAVGLRGSGVPASPAPQPVAGPSREHPEWGPPPAARPVHMVSDDTAVMPCCGLSETGVPATDYVTANPRLVTCNAGQPPWYGWHDTAADDPPAHDRPYVPEDEQAETAAEAEAYMPRFPADLRDLPVFRTVARSHGWAPAGLVRMRAAS